MLGKLNMHISMCDFCSFACWLIFAVSGSFYENIDHTKWDFEFGVYIACSE